MTENVSKSSRIRIVDADQARSEIGKGSAWMIVMRWTIRLIGVVSTIILARLLTPEDFGIVAIAMLIVNFVEVLAESGQRLAIIRHAEDTRDLYDSAWTLSIIQGVALTVLILALSPLTAVFFNEPRSFVVIIALAFRPLITSLENIGIIAFRKELNFRQDFKFGILKKLSSFVLTISAAVLLQNHWALVIGVLGGGIISVGISYGMHPFRPRIHFSRMRELLSFSVHILSQSVMRFLSQRLDEFVVGGLAGTKSMGLYNVAADVGTAPTAELVNPMVRSLYPIYGKLAHDPAALRQTYLSTLSMIATLAFAAGTGVALVAREMVDTVLGAQWQAASGIIFWLSLAAAAAAIAESATILMNPIGRERLATRLSWINILLLLPALTLAGLYGEVEDIAAARLAVSLVMVPICLIAVGRMLGLRLGDFALVFWRPALAAGAMALVLNWLDQRLDVPVAWDLLISVLVGAITFSAVVAAAWLLAGRPRAFETTAIELAGIIWSRLFRRPVGGG